MLDPILSYLSRSLADRWSTTVDVTTSFLHSWRVLDATFQIIAESYQWLKMSIQVASLLDLWYYGVFARTGWPGTGILWLRDITSLLWCFQFTVIAPIIAWAHLGFTLLLGRLATTQQMYKHFFKVASSVWFIYIWEHRTDGKGVIMRGEAFSPLPIPQGSKHSCWAGGSPVWSRSNVPIHKQRNSLGFISSLL